jgi:hypothetical protein
MALEVDHIWIDSLCIVQDDPFDWRDQASQMACVYQNSYITLAATTSANHESGCLWRAEASYPRPFQTGAGSFSVRRAAKHWEKLSSLNSAAVFPLLSRAWVFQERLLASRVIHFSHNELIWECMQAGTCQCGGYDVLTNPKLQDWASAKSWRMAVELYTSLNLTWEQDRLPAFLGFANFYARRIGASVELDYFSGLWKQSLFLDLLWRVDSLYGLGTSPNLHCAHGYRTLDRQLRCQHPRALDSSESQSGETQLQAESENSSTEQNGPKATTQKEGATGSKIAPSFIGNTETDAVPSWSWASARTRVNYWHDVEARSASRPLVSDVNYTGRALSASVRPGVLKVSGWLTTTYLRYHRPRNTVGINNHDSYRYGVDIWLGRTPLEIYADDVFCAKGDWWIPQRSPVYLLHIISDVYLVLKEKKFFKLDATARLRAKSPFGGSIFEPSSKLTFSAGDKFVRIGILRSAVEFSAYHLTQRVYDVDIE